MFDSSAVSSFPMSGLQSAFNSAVPSSSGTVAVTEIRNILNDEWAQSAVAGAANIAATANFASKYGIPASNVLQGSAVSNLGRYNNSCASGLWNTNALGSLSTVSLTGLNKILKTGANSISAALGDLQISNSLQSLAAGLARSISETASGVFALLDRALSATPAAAKNLVALATKLMGAAMKAVDLFSGAFDLAAKGLLGLKDIDLGELISGGLSKLGSMVGGAINSIIGGVSGLIGNVSNLAKNLMEQGISVLVPSDITLGKLASLFSPVTGLVSTLANGVGEALSKLNLDTLSAIASKIGETLAGVLGSIASTVSDIASGVVNGVKNTVERIKGVMFIDGEWKNNFSLSKFANLSLASIWSALRALSNGGNSTAASSIFSSLSGLSQLSGKNLQAILGRSSASSPAVSVLLAAVLGTSAPIQGSFLTTANDGWLGTPSTASAGVQSALSEACAFNAAMMAALASFLTAGNSSIDELMHALECRRSSYTNIADQLVNSRNSTSRLVDALTGLLRLLSVGNYGDVCRSC